MCLIKSVPDNDGDFIAPARVFQPKSTSNRSSYYSQNSSRRHYATAQHSPRHSNPYTVPPPPTVSVPRSLQRAGLVVPPPLVIQEVAPRSAPYTVPPPPTYLALAPQAPFVLPAPQPPPQFPLPPAQTTLVTQIREPSRQPSTRAVAPPPVPDAPPAATERRHSRDHSRSSHHSSRGRAESRQSSAPRTPLYPPQLSPHVPRRHPSTSTRSHRSEDLGSESSRHSHRNSQGSRTGRLDGVSPELPHRSASQRSIRFLQEPKVTESIFIQNKDGTRVKQYYYV